MPRPTSWNLRSNNNPMNTPALRLSRNVIHPVVLALGAALLFAGCGTTKDTKSRDDIASLKTTHLAFIDEFTEGAGKTWDDQKQTTNRRPPRLPCSNTPPPTNTPTNTEK